MYIFSYSYLGGNQIEELPSRIFTYNTELTVLWVTHLYVHILYYWLERRILPTAEEFKTQPLKGKFEFNRYRKVDKLPPPLSTIKYQRATQTDEAVAEIHDLNL